MSVQLTREALLHGVTAAAAFVPVRTTADVLKNLVLDAGDEGLRITGSDLDNTVCLRVPADVSTPGRVTAPAQELKALASQLPDAPVELEATEGELRLRCGRVRVSFPTRPVEDYPTPHTVDFGRAIALPGELLRTLSSRTAFAASTEETARPIICGVLCQLRLTEIRMIATDGHRLARQIVPLDAADIKPADLIIAPKALTHIERFAPSDEDILLAWDEFRVAFRAGEAEVTSNLIAGPYPDYEQILPKDSDRVVTIEKSALQEALGRVSVVASKMTHRVRFSFGNGLVQLSAQSPDSGSANEEIEARFDGEPLELGFNSRYTTESLKRMPGESIRLEMGAPERAVIMRPVDDSVAGSYVHLVMPLRLLD